MIELRQEGLRNSELTSEIDQDGWQSATAYISEAQSNRVEPVSPPGLAALIDKREVFPELRENFIYARMCGSMFFTATSDRLRIRTAVEAPDAELSEPVVFGNTTEITFEGEINRCAVSNAGRNLAVSVGDVLSIYAVSQNGGQLKLTQLASYPFADFDAEGGNISFSEDGSELRAYTRSGQTGKFPVERA